MGPRARGDSFGRLLGTVGTGGCVRVRVVGVAFFGTPGAVAIGDIGGGNDCIENARATGAGAGGIRGRDGVVHAVGVPDPTVDAGQLIFGVASASRGSFQ